MEPTRCTAAISRPGTNNCVAFRINRHIVPFRLKIDLCYIHSAEGASLQLIHSAVRILAVFHSDLHSAFLVRPIIGLNRINSPLMANATRSASPRHLVCQASHGLVLQSRIPVSICLPWRYCPSFRTISTVANRRSSITTVTYSHEQMPTDMTDFINAVSAFPCGICAAMSMM